MLYGADGHVVSNGLIHFYNRKSGDYAAVFGDSAQNVQLRQPVQADGSGMVPKVYLDDSTDYRVVIADAQNNPLREIADARDGSEGLKLLNGLAALRGYQGQSDLVLVQGENGCPAFYRRLESCGEQPAENAPSIIHGHCCSVWKMCSNEPDICSVETADLNCDFQVLVQECADHNHADGTPAQGDCHCTDAAPASTRPEVKKASIGALLDAAARCAPRVCIPHDAPEWTLVGGQMAYGDREPSPLQFGVLSGELSGCVNVVVGSQVDIVSRHIRLDTLFDLHAPPKPVYFPKIQLTNTGLCKRRYEIRAINRLNRANENPLSGASFGEIPVVNANFQTRLGKITDPRIDAVLGVVDFGLKLNWLTDLSIADSTMGPFRSGIFGDSALSDHPYASAAGYTENNLIVDLNPGDSIWYALKYHIYWDMNATIQQLSQQERIHFGTRIMARQIH